MPCVPSFRAAANLDPSAVAGSLVVTYWTSAVPTAAWITIFIVLIVVLNLLGIKLFGEIEVLLPLTTRSLSCLLTCSSFLQFWASFLKIVTLAGLILLGLIIDLGGVPNVDRIGFRFWREQPFSHYLFQNDTGVFLGVWSCMTSALFAYMVRRDSPGSLASPLAELPACSSLAQGIELVGVTFGEAKVTNACARRLWPNAADLSLLDRQNPRKTVPATIRRTFIRILVFYIGSVFVVGLILKATDPGLIAVTKKRTSAAASPFVLAIERAEIRVLPDIINGAILLFVLSAANSDLVRPACCLPRRGCPLEKRPL